MPDYYRILGVSPAARADEIQRAYRQLVRLHHPDVSGDSSGSRFRVIQDAFETLGDETRRRLYDAARQIPVRAADLASSARPDWFADEVAVDFPSIQGLLERMCGTLFEPEGLAGQVSAEIPLTVREAHMGVTIPLDVPLRRTCPLCGGRGEIWMEACGMCGGSGERQVRHPVRLVVPPRVRHGTRFRFSVTSPSAPTTCIEVRITVG